MELGKPAEAVPYLQKSIDYYEKQNAQGFAIEDLIGQLLGALLKTKQYPQAAEFGAQMCGPQSLVLHLLLQRAQDAHHLGVVFVVRVKRDEIERFELFGHELFDPVQLRLIFRVCLEVPHCRPPFSGATSHRHLGYR